MNLRRINGLTGIAAFSLIMAGCLDESMVDKGAADKPEPGENSAKGLTIYQNDGTIAEYPYEIVEDFLLVEGDMKFPLEHLKSQDVLKKSSGNFLNSANKWKGGVIPYKITTTNATKRAWINAGIAEINSKTGVRFVPVGSADPDFVDFVDNASACQSYVGRITGRQTIDVDLTGCNNGGLLHELGHAVGLMHEHQRQDRNSNITLTGNWSSDLVNWGTSGNPFSTYDKYSLMHYRAGDYSYTLDGTPINVNLTNASGTPAIARGNLFSSGDIECIGFLYPSTVTHNLDINNDGRMDAVFINNGIIRIALGGIEGASVTPTVFNPGIGVYPAAYYKVGDFNGDKYGDMLMIVTGTSYVHPFWGNASGSFNVGYFSPLPGYGIQDPAQFHVGDFNNDGRSDIMHFVLGADYVQIWSGQPNNTFTLAGFRPWTGYGINGARVKVGDFDGDGFTDVVDMLGTYSHIWRNTRNGSYAVSTFIPWNGYAVGSADQYQVLFHNGDNRADLIHLPFSHKWLGNANISNGFTVTN